MIPEEAINLLDNLIGMVDDNHDSDYDGALKMAINALEKQEKYKWHDLRKNPEDLPSKYGCDWVIAQVAEDCGYRWMPSVMEYRPDIDDWYGDTLGWIKPHKGLFKVIAWREIEPFEEERK